MRCFNLQSILIVALSPFLFLASRSDKQLATEVDDSFEAINDSVYQLSMNFREQLQDLRDDVEDDVKESIKTVEGKVDNLSDQSDEREDESIQRDAAMSLELSAVKEELQKAQACGADLKIYTKDGCAVLPPSTAEITTSSKCISSNKGEVGYLKDKEQCAFRCVTVRPT